jgi:ribosomal protein S18 acetylase RimI-like enzyme
VPSSDARPYAGQDDLVSLARFVQQLPDARQRQPSYYHPGDVAWQLYSVDRSDDVRIWRDGGAIAAFAIFEPPLTFQFALQPNAPPELSIDVLAWIADRRALAGDVGLESVPIAYRHLGTRALATTAFDHDEERIALLEAHGYERSVGAGLRFARALDAPLPEIELPPGARFRRMTDGDAEARAELHRAAWNVWGPSQHTTEQYRKLRAAPLYDADLDVVLEHDGVMVSYCVCWTHDENRVGYFEPVGTRASATRRGYGRAVVREGMRRLRAKGMEVAFVGTAAVNAPAAALYVSAGFTGVARERFYVKAAR